MRISDWSSDVCSSDLAGIDVVGAEGGAHQFLHQPGFLVGAARRRNGADGVAAIFALNALELGCGIRDSFVPTDFAPRVGCALEDHGIENSVCVRGVAQGETTLEAEEIGNAPVRTTFT